MNLSRTLKSIWPGGDLWPNCLWTPVILTGLSFLLPLTLLYAPKAVVLLYGLAALTALVDVGRGRAQWPELAGVFRRMLATSWPLFLLVGVALVSALWSMDFGVSLGRAGRLALEVVSLFPLLLVVRAMPATAQRRVAWALVCGMAVAIGFLVVEVATGVGIARHLRSYNGNPLSLFNRAISIYVMLLPIVYLWARRMQGRAVTWMLVGVIGLAGLLLESLASTLAIVAVGGILLLMRYVRRDLLVRGLAAVTVAGVLMLPVVTHFLAKPAFVENMSFTAPVSAIHRLHIWQFTTQKIAEEPVLGHGMDTSHLFHHNPAWRVFIPGHPWPVDLIPNHPHNGALQIWLELGALGAIAVALLLHNLWRWVAAVQDRRLQMLFCLALITDLIIWLTAYGTWQGQWLASLGWQVVFLQLSYGYMLQQKTDETA